MQMSFGTPGVILLSSKPFANCMADLLEFDANQFPDTPASVTEDS